MEFTPVPTLKKMALLKLATRVCCIDRYKILLDSHIVSLITEKVSSLKLPKSLFKSLGSLLKPVIMEIFSWIFYISHIHNEVNNFSRITCFCLKKVETKESIQWQSVGLIDKCESFLRLIQDERLDTAFRFVLACNCCSESNILILWQRLSPVVQLRFIKTKFSFLPVVNYWTNRLEKAQSVDYKFIPNPPFPYVFEFDYSIKYLETMYSYYQKMPELLRYYLFGTYGKSLDHVKMQIIRYDQAIEYRNRVTVGLVNVDNVAALKYFLQKFEPIKGQKLIEVVAGNHFISNELLVFCVSKMSNSQLTAMLKTSRRSRVLSCFLNSPWQHNFWNLLDSITSDVTASDLQELYNYLCEFKIKQRWLDNDYVAEARRLQIRYEQVRR